MPTFIFQYKGVLAIYMPLRGEYITDPHPAGHNAGVTIATKNIQITEHAKKLIRELRVMGSKPLASERHNVPVFQLNRHVGADALMYGPSSVTVLSLGSSKLILGRSTYLTLPYGTDFSVLDDMEEVTEWCYPQGFLEQMKAMESGGYEVRSVATDKDVGDFMGRKHAAYEGQAGAISKNIQNLMERQAAADLKPDMGTVHKAQGSTYEEARADHKFMDLGATKDELRALQVDTGDQYPRMVAGKANGPAPVLLKVQEGEAIRPRTDPFSDTSTQPIRHYKGEPIKAVSELVEARGVYMSYNGKHGGFNCVKSLSVVQDRPDHNALCLVYVGHPDALNVALNDEDVEMLYQALDRFRRRSK
jgi:hypothetical protein